MRLPPVTKRPDGSYASARPTTLAHTVAARSAALARTAEAFRPHVVIVDKEPAGFHGEMLPVLASKLQQLGTFACNQLFVCRDNRFAGFQRTTHPLLGRIE